MKLHAVFIVSNHLVATHVHRSDWLAMVLHNLSISVARKLRLHFFSVQTKINQKVHKLAEIQQNKNYVTVPHLIQKRC